jgi:hypothetical protein
MPANGEPLPARHGKCGVSAGTARQSPNPKKNSGIAGNFTSRHFAVCRHASLGYWLLEYWLLGYWLLGYWLLEYWHREKYTYTTLS